MFNSNPLFLKMKSTVVLHLTDDLPPIAGGNQASAYLSTQYTMSSSTKTNTGPGER